MKNFWDHKKEIGSKLSGSPGILLFLDFDGTLSPIVTDFKNAKTDPAIKQRLELIVALDSVFVMIVSGRKLEYLKEKIDIPGLNLGGNHGLEWIINGDYNRYPFDNNINRSLDAARKIYSELANKFHGIFIEDKSLSLSLHYRNLEEIGEEEFKDIFDRSIKPIKDEGILEFIAGKKVIDARPKADWNKGKIVNMLKERFPDRMIFAVGDDTTDEDMFKESPDGITVRVGQDDASKAEYYVDDIADVNRLLDFLHQTLTRGPNQ
jgi:trehalose 6-phosphate phosphatase